MRLAVEWRQKRGNKEEKVPCHAFLNRHSPRPADHDGTTHPFRESEWFWSCDRFRRHDNSPQGGRHFTPTRLLERQTQCFQGLTGSWRLRQLQAFAIDRRSLLKQYALRATETRTVGCKDHVLASWTKLRKECFFPPLQVFTTVLAIGGDKKNGSGSARRP